MATWFDFEQRIAPALLRQSLGTLKLIRQSCDFGACDPRARRSRDATPEYFSTYSAVPEYILCPRWSPIRGTNEDERMGRWHKKWRVTRSIAWCALCRLVLKLIVRHLSGHQIAGLCSDWKKLNHLRQRVGTDAIDGFLCCRMLRSGRIEGARFVIEMKFSAPFRWIILFHTFLLF
jgi:hypothetical protein